MVPKKIIIKNIFNPLKECFYFNSYRSGAKWLFEKGIAKTYLGALTSISRVVDKEDTMYNKYIVVTAKEEQDNEK